MQRAIAAGKHVYCEKPVAGRLADALAAWRAAEAAGIRHGVVQDKLWLPGLLKLRMLIESGFFGRILSVKGDFGGKGVREEKVSGTFSLSLVREEKVSGPFAFPRS